MQKQQASMELARIGDAIWLERLADEPLFATSVGRHEFNQRLPDVSVAALSDRAGRERARLEELRAIATEEPDATDATGGLDATECASWAVLEGLLVDSIANFDFCSWQMPVNADSGFHIEFASLPELAPFRRVSDYQHYIARLEAWPLYVDQQIANMRLGIESGRTLPRVVLQGYESTISAHVVTDPSDSVFWGPFRTFVAGVATADRARLEGLARRAIGASLVPGYARFLRFFESEYVPAARATLAASDLPDGRAYYEQQVRSFTTLDLDPAEVHQIGLDEVARIRCEMQNLIERIERPGADRDSASGDDFAAFLHFLRSDPRFFAATPDELLERARGICRQVDAALPELFSRLPNQPYEVAAVPAELAPKYTSGRYVPAAPDTGEPAKYWVNTFALESRPLYALPALTLHEAVPGHHLQIALASENTGLPEFRRHVYHPAYGEGWALYAERLGLEIGIYDDPFDDFGRLTYEMWRACRLVVDTGLHAQHWSRERAVDYLASNTALSLHEVNTEIDRYISWPAQALAYKLGELEIKRLRQRAVVALGSAFDVRAFHDAILSAGSVPLSSLRAEIERFVARQAEACD